MLCQMKRVALNSSFSAIKGKIADQVRPFENIQKKDYSSLIRGSIYQAPSISKELYECRKDCISFRFFPEFDYSFLLF